MSGCDCGCEELLHAARDELYHARVLLASARNRTKLETAALTGSVDRLEALTRRIETRLNGSPRPKEAQGEHGREHLSSAVRS